MHSILFNLLFILVLFTSPLYALETDDASAATEKVVLQLKWLHQFQFAGYYAAAEKGYFDEEGLEVIIRERKSGTNLLQEVIEGNAQYGIGDSGLIAEYARGSPIRILAAIFQHDPLVFITKQSSGILTAQELRGKRIMYDKSSGGDTPLRGFLAEAGINEEDYTFIPHTYHTQDLVDDRVDVMSAYLTNEPYLFSQKGIKISVFNPRSFGLDFYGDMLFTSEREVSQHPGRPAKFRRAVIKGWQYALDHPEEIIQLIKTKYHSNKSIEHLRFEAEATKRLIIPGLVEIGHIDSKRIAHLTQLFSELDGTPGLSEKQINRLTINHTEDFQLTPEEKAWLDQNPVIRLGIDQTFAPFEWLDENGNFLGMSADFMQLIENQLGIRFEIIKNLTWKQTLELAREGKIHMLADATRTPDREKYLLFTEPYAYSPILIIGDTAQGYIGDLRNLYGKKVAIEEGYFMQDILLNEHPHIELIPTKTEYEALQLIEDQKARAYIGDGISLNYLIQQEGLLNLRFAGETGYRSGHSVAVSRLYPLLYSIMQKAIKKISPQDKENIRNRWMSSHITRGIKKEVIAQYAIVFLVIVALFIYWNMRLRREIRSRKNSEQLLRQLLSTSPIAVRIARSAGREVIFANQSYEKLINSKIKFATGVDPKSYYVNPSDYEEVLAMLRKGEQIYNRLVELKIPNSDNKWALATYYPFSYEGETAVLGWFYDVTEQKKNDALRQTALIEAEKAKAIAIAAEQANEMKSHFLANISHELRTPTHAILNFSQLALRKAEDEKLQRYLDNILTSSRRLSRLLNDLLDLAKLEAGKMEMHFKHENINRIIFHCIEILDSLISEKQLLIDIDAGLEFEAEFDPNRIEQVITNLLSNAIKFSPQQSKITITIKNTESLPDSGSQSQKQLQVSVSDMGTGIPENEFTTIFDKFIQSSKTRTTSGGTGLGLAICKDIILCHHGHIWAEHANPESKDHPGAKISFEIPLKQQKMSNKD